MLTTFQKAVLATIALSALLITVAVGGRGAAATTLILPPNTGGPAAGIVTTGDATVKRRPDIALITVGVTVQAATAADAQSQAADRVAKILARAKQLGVADADTKNGGYAIQPQYAYGPNQAPKITGYQATQQIVLTYRKVADAGAALDALVQNDGATNASLQLALEDPKGAQADARTKAVADAKAKAQAMADAAGVRLGAAISVSDQSSAGGVALDSLKFRDAASAPAAQTQIPVSDLDIVIRVTVQFAIG
ncbi:MAG TPA: SIMPL domain-containing protein [Candidatus Limnocylindria bacterium]|nr:SIMPL domain-containing protein [Candidatus Limnocylindria bacterium]